MLRTIIVGLILLAVFAGGARWVLFPGAVHVTTEVTPQPEHPIAPGEDRGSFDPACCNGICSTGHQGHVQDVRDFDIPAGKLPESLYCFDAQAGLLTGWNDTPRVHEQTPALRGHMRAYDAVVLLVENTDLEVVPLQGNDSTVTLRLRRPDAHGNVYQTPTAGPCRDSTLIGKLDDVRDFNIPAGVTPDRAYCFSAQSGVPIVLVGHAAGTVRPTHAVKGRMSAWTAITQLLKGTGFNVQSDDTIVTITLPSQ